MVIVVTFIAFVIRVNVLSLRVTVTKSWRGLGNYDFGSGSEWKLS